MGLNHLPSGRFPANAAWLAVQVMAHNLARWTTRIGLGEQLATTKTLRRRFFSLAGRLTRSAPASTLHLPPRLALAEPVQQRSGKTARPAAPLLTTTTASDHPPHYPIASPTRARLAPECLRRQPDLPISPSAGAAEPSTSPWRGYHTLCLAGLERVKATPPPSSSSHPWLPQGSQVLSVDLGLVAVYP